MNNQARIIRKRISGCLIIAGILLTIHGYGQNAENRKEAIGVEELQSQFDGLWAKNVAGKVYINWKVRGKVASGLFIIERSAYANTGFIPVGAKECIATDIQAPVFYSFTDEKPLAGYNWYRIIKVNDSGDYFISKSFVVDVPLGLPRAMHMISQ